MTAGSSSGRQRWKFLLPAARACVISNVERRRRHQLKQSPLTSSKSEMTRTEAKKNPPTMAVSSWRRWLSSQRTATTLSLTCRRDDCWRNSAAWQALKIGLLRPAARFSPNKQRRRGAREKDSRKQERVDRESGAWEILEGRGWERQREREERRESCNRSRFDKPWVIQSCGGPKHLELRRIGRKNYYCDRFVANRKFHLPAEKLN